MPRPWAIQRAEIAAVAFNAMAQPAPGSLPETREHLTGTVARRGQDKPFSVADEIKPLADLRDAQPSPCQRRLGLGISGRLHAMECPDHDQLR